MNPSPNPSIEFSENKAALIAGLGVLLMALTVPIVEFYIFPELINYENGQATVTNIVNNRRLFSTAIFIHFVTIICDVTIAWALYVFLKPVHQYFALLVSLFRLVYASFNIVALLHLIQVLSILTAQKYFTVIQPAEVNDQVLFYVRSFHMEWRFGLIFFGFYMVLLSVLTLKADYVPKFVSLCAFIAGLGYLIENLKYFFYPSIDTGFLWFTFFAELIMMVWLLKVGFQRQAIRGNSRNANDT